MTHANDSAQIGCPYLRDVPSRLPAMSNRDDLAPFCPSTGGRRKLETNGHHWEIQMVTIFRY